MWQSDIVEGTQTTPSQTTPSTSGCATAGDMDGAVAMETEEEDALHGMKCCAPIAEVCVCGVLLLEVNYWCVCVYMVGDMALCVCVCVCVCVCD